MENSPSCALDHSTIPELELLLSLLLLMDGLNANKLYHVALSLTVCDKLKQTNKQILKMSVKMKLSLFNLCPCCLQDVPLLSSAVLMAPAAMCPVEACNTQAFSTGMGTARARHGPDNWTQKSSFLESGESWREAYTAEEQYGGLEFFALSDEFLHEYYSQVRNYESVLVVLLFTFILDYMCMCVSTPNLFLVTVMLPTFSC